MHPYMSSGLRATPEKTCQLGRGEEDLPSDNEKETRERKRSVPEAFYVNIRATMFTMYAEKKRVALGTLPAELKAQRSTRSSAWIWSRTTLHRVLTGNMASSYGQCLTHHKSLHEKGSIDLQRLQYIQRVRSYRAEERQIYYQGEKWVTKKMTPSNVWLDGSGNRG